MKVHGNDVVAASCLEHVCHELSRDGCTALVLLILARVGEVGNDSGDTPGGSSFASVDHDEELHESIIDVVRLCRLQDEN